MSKQAKTTKKGRAGAKGGKKARKEKVEPFVRRTQPPRLRRLYQEEILPALMKEFGYTSPMAAPRM